MPRPTTPETIGKRLVYAYRLHPGAYRNDADAFSLRELDRLAGVGEGLASQIVGERATNPTIATLRGLAGVLGCSVGWLSDGEGAGPVKAQVVRAVKAARATAANNEEQVNK